MKKLMSLFGMVLIAAFQPSAHAQNSVASEPVLGQVPLKHKPAIAIEQTLFAARPILCDGAPCDLKLKPKLKPKDFCVTAICLPIEPKAIPKILGPDALHWRIKFDGSMAQFIGDTQLSDYSKASYFIPLDASIEQIKVLPVVGLRTSSGSGAVQYWVRTK